MDSFRFLAAPQTAMLAAIDADSRPKAEMLIQIAPAIRKIVQARAN